MTLPETPPQPSSRRRSPVWALAGDLPLVGQEIPRYHDSRRRAQAPIPVLSCGTHATQDL